MSEGEGRLERQEAQFPEPAAHPCQACSYCLRDQISSSGVYFFSFSKGLRTPHKLSFPVPDHEWLAGRVAKIWCVESSRLVVDLNARVVCGRYAIYFVHRYFHDFRLSGEIRESLISRFSDVFITINKHILKLKCSRGLTREIHENKTTAKISTYTVSAHMTGHEMQSHTTAELCRVEAFTVRSLSCGI